MPKIITILTKKDSDPWMDQSLSDFYTQNEIDTIINPYTDYVKGMKGYIDTERVYSGNTETITRNFETPEDARNFFNALKDGPNPIIGKFMTLTDAVSKRTGIQYTKEIKYEK